MHQIFLAYIFRAKALILPVRECMNVVAYEQMCDVLIAGRLVFWRNRKLPAAIDQRPAYIFFFCL